MISTLSPSNTNLNFMGRNGGFKLRKNLLRFFTSKWLFRRKTQSKHPLIDPSPPLAADRQRTGDDDERYVDSKPFFNWGRLIRRRAKLLCFFKLHHSRRHRHIHHRTPGNYIPLGNEPGYDNRKTDRKRRMAMDVPKGHLAVCVGENEEEKHKVVVPLIYLNHPLFAELLKEAEEEYGFSRPGHITLPCPLSKFETVQMSISAGVNCRHQRGHHVRPASKQLCLPC